MFTSHTLYLVSASANDRASERQADLHKGVWILLMVQEKTDQIADPFLKNRQRKAVCQHWRAPNVTMAA